MERFKNIKNIVIAMLLVFFLTGCLSPLTNTNRTVPHEQRWGIYSLDLENQAIELIYSDSEEISSLHLNPGKDMFVFSKKINGDEYSNYEICTLNTDGSELKRLTENNYWDIYPRWSPDGTRILFLSFREKDLDIYIMDGDGGSVKLLYDSGNHDADIDWQNNKIVFTAQSCIWIMNEDGTEPERLTNPPKAGEWGDAVLPFGDYDPRLSYDGKTIVFERQTGDSSVHGNYDLFTVSSDGTGLKQITANGYTQGLANWSKDGSDILYMVAAIDSVGLFDIFIISSDGEDNQNITPDYFPDDFLCHDPIFAKDENSIFFIGEWWEE